MATKTKREVRKSRKASGTNGKPEREPEWVELTCRSYMRVEDKKVLTEFVEDLDTGVKPLTGFNGRLFLRQDVVGLHQRIIVTVKVLKD